MIAFVDNDVVMKLAACDLLDSVVATLQISHDCIFVLATAQFSLCVRRNQDKGRRRYGPEVHHRICAFVDCVNVSAAEPRADDLEALLAVEGIDSGEAILIALSAQTPDSIFVTGDKRAIRSLGSAAGLGKIRAALQGRVYCLEYVVRLSIKSLGFSTALPRIVAGSGCDKALGSAFGSGLKTVEANAIEVLRNYEEELRKDAFGLLVGGK